MITYSTENVKFPNIKRRETTAWIRRVAASYGKKVGDVITVHVNDNYSYEAEIKSITKGRDDGSVPLLGY